MEHYGCDQDKCGCPCHADHDACHNHDHEHDDDMNADYFLQLADEAWEEVLKDKIKEYILKTKGDDMTKLAKIVAEGNHRRWKHRIEKKQSCHHFMEELEAFFNQKK